MKENRFNIGDRVSFLMPGSSDFEYVLNTDGEIVSEMPTEIGLFYNVSFPSRFPYQINVFNRMIKPYEKKDRETLVAIVYEDNGKKVFVDDNGRVYDFDNVPPGAIGGMGF